MDRIISDSKVYRGSSGYYFKLLEHFGRYGAPKEILTDRGAQYVNKLVTLVCETYGTKFRKTTIAHSHEQNAKVENVNRQVLTSVRAFILENVLCMTGHVLYQPYTTKHWLYVG